MEEVLPRPAAGDDRPARPIGCPEKNRVQEVEKDDEEDSRGERETGDEGEGSDPPSLSNQRPPVKR
jgi:hypothetical protein